MRGQMSDPQLRQLRAHMNHLFEGAGESQESSRLWAPVVDVIENKEEIVVQAELPGMKKEEIDIQLSGDTLVLRGERKLEQAQPGEHFHRVERQYGAWQRLFQIEVPIDIPNVSANYEDGVLSVRLPKQAALKPRPIEIQVK